MAKEWLKANTKVAVITGAAGGIGYGIAKEILRGLQVMMQSMLQAQPI